MKASEVNTRARFMRQAGLLRSGGRGKGAPDMEASDLSAMLLGMVSMSEPTNTGADLAELERAVIFGCEWTDLELTEESFENLRVSFRNKHRLAPPPFFDTEGAEKAPLGALSKLLSVAAARDDLEIQYIEQRMDREGRAVEFVWLQNWTHNEARKAYGDWTRDRTDLWQFPEGDEETRWEIVVEYSLVEPQRDQRQRELRIPGPPIHRIVREALA